MLHSRGLDLIGINDGRTGRQLIDTATTKIGGHHDLVEGLLGTHGSSDKHETRCSNPPHDSILNRHFETSSYAGITRIRYKGFPLELASVASGSQVRLTTPGSL